MPLTLALAFTALAATHALPFEEIESPLYKSWVRFPVGTTITTRAVTERDGHRAETTTTSQLIASTNDKVVIEAVSVSDATGQRIENPPQRFEYRRVFPLLPGVKKEDVGKPKGVIAEGDETVEVAGKSYAAHWYDARGTTDAGPSITRTWMSEEVPGKLLKAITRVPKADKTATLKLVEIRTP